MLIREMRKMASAYDLGVHQPGGGGEGGEEMLKNK